MRVVALAAIAVAAAIVALLLWAEGDEVVPETGTFTEHDGETWTYTVPTAPTATVIPIGYLYPHPRRSDA